MNPARWKGLHENEFGWWKTRQVQHHPALPIAHVPEFYGRLRDMEALSATTLRFVLLTCVRKSEALEAQWGEIDWATSVWAIPASKMKGKTGQKRTHRVPLSSEALKILRERQQWHNTAPDAYIFASIVHQSEPGRGRPQSKGSLNDCVDRIEAQTGWKLTIHGLRSTFHDWATTQATRYRWEAIEAVLAHLIGAGSKTIQAYARNDYMNERRQIMEDWARYFASEPPLALPPPTLALPAPLTALPAPEPPPEPALPRASAAPQMVANPTAIPEDQLPTPPRPTPRARPLRVKQKPELQRSFDF